jgi:hypothetical protein
LSFLWIISTLRKLSMLCCKIRRKKQIFHRTAEALWKLCP